MDQSDAGDEELRENRVREVRITEERKEARVVEKQS